MSTLPRHIRPMASTAATAAFSTIGKPLTADPLEVCYAGKSVAFKSPNGPTVVNLPAVKTLDYLLLKLTAFNKHAGGWANRTISFSLADFSEAMVFEEALSRDTLRDRLDQLISNLQVLSAIETRQDGSPWFRFVNAWRIVGPKGSPFAKKTTDPRGKKYGKADVISGRARIEVRMTEELVDHLKGGRKHPRLSPFPINLFGKSGANANAYAIARRMLLHIASNCRVKNISSPMARGETFALRTQRLIDCCPNLGAARARVNAQRFRQALAVAGCTLTFEENADRDTIEFSLPDWQPYTKFARSHSHDAVRSSHGPQVAKEAAIMEKKRTDPKLYTKSDNMRKNYDARYDVTYDPKLYGAPALAWKARACAESRMIEQVLIVKGVKGGDIKEMRDGNGLLTVTGMKEKDVVLDLPDGTAIQIEPDKTSTLYVLENCQRKHLFELSDKDRVLVGRRWQHGDGVYAQVGILKVPVNDDPLSDRPISDTIIVRQIGDHNYHIGRFYDLLVAVVEATAEMQDEEETTQDVAAQEDVAPEYCEPKPKYPWMTEPTAPTIRPTVRPYTSPSLRSAASAPRGGTPDRAYAAHSDPGAQLWDMPIPGLAAGG